MKKYLLICCCICLFLFTNAQNQTINGNLNVLGTIDGAAKIGISADNGLGHVASKIFLNSHNDYRGAGLFSIGQTNTWFVGNPYTDHANSFIIGVRPTEASTDPVAQFQYAKFYLNKDGDVGIGTTAPTEKLAVEGNIKATNFPISKLELATQGSYNLTLESNHNAVNRFDLKINNSRILGEYRWTGTTPTTYLASFYGLAFLTRTGGEVTKEKIRMYIDKSGNIGMGTITPDEKLAVNGNIHTKEVRVDLTGWSDFVFEENYDLPTLQEVETHIKEKGHLENIPSAKEVEADGIKLGEMNAKLLQKIEELTLYTIEQEKRLVYLTDKLEDQQNEIEELNKNKELCQDLNSKLIQLQEEINQLKN